MEDARVEEVKKELERIKKWENQVEKVKRGEEGEIEELIEQAKGFKYTVKSLGALQDQLDLVKWKENLKKIICNLNNREKPQVTLEEVMGVIMEGKKKGFSE